MDFSKYTKLTVRIVGFIILIVKNNVTAQSKTDKPVERLNFENLTYNPIPRISLEHYKSVQTRKNQDPNLALGLSLSGGGTRAQYFSTGVMIGLDEISNSNNSSILKEVDYISSVSGGGFAAGNYLSLLHNGILEQYKTLGDFWLSNDRDIYQKELNISTKGHNLIFMFGRKRLKYGNKILQTVLFDKSQLKNECNRINIDDCTQTTSQISEGLFLESIFVNKNSCLEVRYPYYVANSSVYTNGDRFPFIPHIIDTLQITGVASPYMMKRKKIRERKYSRSFYDKNGKMKIPLQIPIAASAAFPALLPIVNLKNKDNKIIRVLDGGLTDNFGVETLSELLAFEKKDNIKKRAIIVNCAGSGLESHYSEKKDFNLRKFIPRALLYPVEMNIKNSSNKYKEIFNKVDASSILLEMKVIKDHISVKNDSISAIISQVKDINNPISWLELNTKFTHRIDQDFSKKIVNLDQKDFEKFNDYHKFLLYELSSQVITKLRIDSWEKEALILAGRYVVFLKKDELKEIIN